jgi:prepilin-type N-terminal cleavage/methylation domain-containing protein
MKGFTLIELLIVVAIIAILAAIAIPNFLEAQVRSKVSRVKADERSLANGLEAYYVDNNDYPAMGVGNAGANGFAGITVPGSGGTTGARHILTFRVNVSATTDLFRTMTTPQAYVTSYFPDPFADTKGCCFAYYKDTNGWIVASFGPDTDENGANTTYGDLGLVNGWAGTGTETEYSSSIAQPSLQLLTGSGYSGDCYTYDPTNGTVTPGDVYRVKQ